MRQQVEEAEQSLYVRRTTRADLMSNAQNGILSDELQSVHHFFFFFFYVLKLLMR